MLPDAAQLRARLRPGLANRCLASPAGKTEQRIRAGTPWPASRGLRPPPAPPLLVQNPIVTLGPPLDGLN
eukprot:249529-Lingulodinium_polyedra.AAC.1